MCFVVDVLKSPVKCFVPCFPGLAVCPILPVRRWRYPGVIRRRKSVSGITTLDDATGALESRGVHCDFNVSYVRFQMFYVSGFRYFMCPVSDVSLVWFQMFHVSRFRCPVSDVSCVRSKSSRCPWRTSWSSVDIRRTQPGTTGFSPSSLGW